jgi:hypothetical protein
VFAGMNQEITDFSRVPTSVLEQLKHAVYAVSFCLGSTKLVRTEFDLVMDWSKVVFWPTSRGGVLLLSREEAKKKKVHLNSLLFEFYNYMV